MQGTGLLGVHSLLWVIGNGWPDGVMYETLPMAEKDRSGQLVIDAGRFAISYYAALSGLPHCDDCD